MDDTFETIFVPENSGIPNNPILPAVVAAKAVGSNVTANEVRATYRRNGWGGTWIYTVFDYHHYHPASHEVLTCVSGSAKLQLGGPEGPVVDVQPGDAIILPAGFGHKRVTSTSGFAVVGAYPQGQESPAIIPAGGLDLDKAHAEIAATALPKTDPLSGPNGPLMTAWAP